MVSSIQFVPHIFLAGFKPGLCAGHFCHPWVGFYQKQCMCHASIINYLYSLCIPLVRSIFYSDSKNHYFVEQMPVSMFLKCYNLNLFNVGSIIIYLPYPPHKLHFQFPSLTFISHTAVKFLHKPYLNTFKLSF